MFSKNRHINNEIDRVGQLVLRAAAQNESEAQAAADAPFLFTRVRARIAEEERRQNETGGWLSLPLVARRAIPAMAFVALLTAGITFWPSSTNAPAGWYRLDDEALADTRNPGVEQAVLSRNNLSHEDVFSIVLEQNGREKR